MNFHRRGAVLVLLVLFVLPAPSQIGGAEPPPLVWPGGISIELTRPFGLVLVRVGELAERPHSLWTLASALPS